LVGKPPRRLIPAATGENSWLPSSGEE
jgi:hypothetical protein